MDEERSFRIEDSLELAAARDLEFREDQDGLSPEQLELMLRPEIYRRYLMVYRKLQRADGLNALSPERYSEMLEKLKTTFVKERSLEEWEQVIGPERPSGEMLEALIEDLSREGHLVAAIGKKPEYMVKNGKIFGVVGLLEESGTRYGIKWYPVFDDQIVREAMNPRTGNARNIGMARSLSWDFRPDAPWVVQATDAGPRAFLFGSSLFLKDGGFYDPFSDLASFSVREGNFDRKGQFTGLLDGQYRFSDGREHFAVLEGVGEWEGERFQDRFGGQPQCGVFLHEDLTVSTVVASKKGKPVIIHRDQKIQTIDGKRIQGVHDLFADSFGWSGWLDVADIGHVLVLENQVVYRQGRDDSGKREVRKWVRGNGQWLALRNETQQRGREEITPWYGQVLEGSFGEVQMPDVVFEKIPADASLWRNIQQVSLSEKGRVECVINDTLRIHGGREYFVTRAMNGDEIQSEFMGRQIDRIEEYHVYDGRVNGRFSLRNKDRTISECLVVMGKIVKEQIKTS